MTVPSSSNVRLDILLTGKAMDARAASACLAYGQVWSGRFTTIGVEVLLTTTQ
jgi:hypothetical protein